MKKYGHASPIPLLSRLGPRVTWPLMAVFLFFAGGVLSLGYFKAREEVMAGAAAHIRQLAGFAAIEEAYARQWIKASVAPILGALEDAGPARLQNYENYQLRLEEAIMAAMPAERGQLDIRVYLDYTQGQEGRRQVNPLPEEPRHLSAARGWGGVSFIRGQAPSHFVPDQQEVSQALLAVYHDQENWRMLVADGPDGANVLIARYYAPVFQRSFRGLRSPFGVLTADVSLDWLAERIQTVSTMAGAHVFFVDATGHWLLPEALRQTVGASGLKAVPGPYQLAEPLNFAEAGRSLVTLQDKPYLAVYSPLRDADDLMLGLLIPEEQLLGPLNRILILFIFVGLVLLGLAFLSLRRTIGLILGPVRALRRYAEELSVGGFSREPTEAPLSAQGNEPAPFRSHSQWPDEPGRLNRAISRLRTALRQRQRDLGLIGNTRERLFGEMALAGKLQHTLRHATSAPPENILLAAALFPAGHITHEVLDYFSKDQETLCFITAGVTAHGIPAALLMDRLIPLLHEQLLNGADPAEALENANIIIHSYAPIDKTDLSPFVSVCLGAISAKDGRLIWASAGKNPPYRILAGQSQALPWSGDLPLGVKPDAAYHNQTAELQPGETLFFCGVRLLAMLSPTGLAFGEERLEALLGAAAQSPGELITSVHAACLAHARRDTPPEDLALMAIAWLGEKQV